MKPPDIATARLISQQIAGSAFTIAKELVAYMGAMQAQDYAMAKWAIGLRLPGSTEKQLEKALDDGNLLRTHVLRPTWHIVVAEDIYWMLALSAEKIKALMRTTDRQFELTEKIYSKSNNIIAKCFETEKHMDRDGIAASLHKANISTEKDRLSHLLIRAELEGIICSGKIIEGKRTYASLPERVPKKKLLTKDESLALLANKYFISRGPATIEDFSWWAGLTLTDARHGFDMVKPGFATEKINGISYLFSHELKWPVKNKASVFLLPAFDEFIISYKDRTASLETAHHKKIITRNGIFNPSIIVNGQVAGLWKRSYKNEKLAIETFYFVPPDKTVMAAVNKQAKQFGEFSGLATTVS